MQENLVIVESPAKAKTIEKFLGEDYKVMSSYGHIRDLKKKEISVDMDTLEACYEIPADKKKVVDGLLAAAKKSKQVWLASDEDREGEAIAWHLQEVLGLDKEQTKRIVFHEITKPAILNAIDNPRRINMSLVDAQQARRILDRIVGFKLSPVLWRKVKPALSAGRVQSVAVRLIVEREREVRDFVSEAHYRVTAVFTKQDGDTKQEIHAEANHKFQTADEAKAFLEQCKNAAFTVVSVAKKPLKRTPAPPFTTSTLQQEAARKLGFSVSQTMRVAQSLYERGLITYMRTDSVNLSSFCINACKEEIAGSFGENYSRPRNFKTHTRGAQEAHEAIRPAYINRREIDGTIQEQRLYDLIRKRTLASQMADAQMEKTTAEIAVSGAKYSFTATGEAVLFDGFLKVYRESLDDDSDNAEDTARLLPQLVANESLSRKEITAAERFTQGPQRYTEATLVKKMEELGIGRPSTYAPTISTIQQREYVKRGEDKGSERPYSVLTLKGNAVTQAVKKEIAGRDKGKLLPTDIGIVVNDFLMDSFPDIMDYNFTANVEEKFDAIAGGELAWQTMLKEFWTDFEPEIESVIQARQEHKPGERELGTDPKSGKTVFVKIGRYGPVVQIGAASDDEKPRFVQLPKDKTMETITLGEALELLRLPRVIGEIAGKEVVANVGRFGPYILYDKQFTSLPSGEDPFTITLETAEKLIAEKKQKEAQRHIKTFANEPQIEIINGRYGPYLACGGKNYRIPKKQQENAAALTEDECRAIIKEAADKGQATGKRSPRAKKSK